MVTAQLIQVAAFLAAAAIAAPLGRSLRVGAVLGYLAAGVIIGPYVLGPLYALDDVGKLLHFGEFGVVMLLFVIGLELRPVRLWAMRSSIFGLGTAQLVVTTDSRNYPAGRNPEFTLSVSNAGRSACRIDLRRHTAQFVVTSGPDRIWSTADCLKPQTASALVVEPGRSVLILRVDWRRVRSAPDCPADPQRAKPGTYVLTGSLTGLAGAKDVFGLR